jgi:hypothetical protein
MRSREQNAVQILKGQFSIGFIQQIRKKKRPKKKKRKGQLSQWLHIADLLALFTFKNCIFTLAGRKGVVKSAPLLYMMSSSSCR